ncbi:hypothetical protein UZ36_04320 [Candidatus Nitromaritima sp. SCGC AAA799-C22]|nr:hypothetical protein UZ36_04320 [Candidatus Nitromaritima sp. SCGC AAA799-C22]
MEAKKKKKEISKKKGLVVYSLGSLFAVFLIVTGLVCYQLNDLDNLKGMAVDKLEDLTGRRVSIGAAELDFVKGISVRLRNVYVGTPGGVNHQFSAQSAWAVVKLWPLLNQKIEIQKLIVRGASFNLVRDEEGKFNLGDPSRWLAEPAQSGLFKVLAGSFMHNLSLLQSEVTFLDYYNVPGSDPLSISVKNINLTVGKQFLQTPFSFNLSGEIPNAHRPTVFQLSGTFDGLGGENGTQPIPIRGKVKVDQLHVPQFRPYLKKVLSAAPEDSWLSLESDFSGSLGGNLRSEGKLKYSTAVLGQKAVLRSMDSPNRGVMDYSIMLDKDSIEIQDLKLRSGSMSFSANGRLAGFSSKNPSISFALQTGEFQIRKTRQYLPLIFFPDSIHRDLQRRFRNGSLEIRSLKFDGSLSQLQELASEENKSRLAADIVLRQVDWRSPLPPLKRVTGSLKYKDGDGVFKIVKARYQDLPISNVKGTVRSMLNHPVADLSVENRMELEKLNRALKKALAGESFENILDDYQDFSGKGVLKVNIQGPLEEPEKISITGILSMENASFYEAEMKSRINNFKGEIHYRHIPENRQERSKSPIPIVRFKDLSGEFGKSAFYDMQGEILREGEKTVRKMTAKYRLNASELPGVIAGIDFGGPLFTALKQADFSEGDVEVDYRNLTDFNHPELEKDWGEIDLKNVSVKHPSGFQPLLKMTGGISFGDGQIRLQKISGWYGNSPIHLEGQLIPKSDSLLGFDLRATSTDWTQPDFKDIPYFENLEFSGPVRAEITLTGDRRSFKFKNRIDLTRAGYRFKEDVHKKENIPNQMDLGGSYTKKDGIVIDRLEFALDNNRVTGKARVKSFIDPEYSIELQASGFKTQPVASVVDVLQHNREGKVDFNISGRGNLNRIEDSWFEGSAVFKDLVFKWEDRANPVTVSADVRFSGKVYDFRKGQLKSGRSKLIFSGMSKNGEHPELVLKLTGKTLAIDELVPAGSGEEGVETDFRNLLEKSRLISEGTSQVSIDLGQLDYKSMTLNNVSGKLLLKDREIKIDGLRVGSKNPIKGSGKFSVKDPEAIRFTAEIKAEKIDADHLVGMFGDHFKDGLTGKVRKLDLLLKSRGKNISEITRSLSGKVSFHLDKGMIDKKKLKEGAFDLFGLKIPVREKSKSEKEEEENPSNYVNISGDFTHVGGVAETENFIYETDQRRTSIVGKFDLNKREMDTVVGVAPLPGLDKFLTKIPVFGKILTAGDEASLLKSYYAVKGPFDDPEVTSIPFTSLGKKVMGIFQGILQTPQEILTLPKSVGSEKVTK